MTYFKPVSIKRIAGVGVEFSLEDGTLRCISNEKLRLSCPCALCKETRGELNHSKPLQARPASLKVVTSTRSEETFLEQIWPVGSYALGMKWRDGHNDGIYSFELLSSLADEVRETR